jgi:acetyl-CoA carboxylase alpha subunit
VASAANLKTSLLRHLSEILALSVPDRLKNRYQKFRAHGHFTEKFEAADAEPVAAVEGSAV